MPREDLILLILYIICQPVLAIIVWNMIKLNKDFVPEGHKFKGEK